MWEEPPITPNDLIIGPHLPLPAPEPEERVNPSELIREIYSVVRSRELQNFGVHGRNISRQPYSLETNGIGQEITCK